MKKYVQPDVTVIFMNSEDVMTTSPITVNSIDDDCGYTPWNEVFGE